MNVAIAGDSKLHQVAFVGRGEKLCQDGTGGSQAGRMAAKSALAVRPHVSEKLGNNFKIGVGKNLCCKDSQKVASCP